MRYLPQTPAEIAEMLATIGKSSVEELFEQIPSPARLRDPLALPPALAEPELMRHLAELSSKNAGASLLSFLGAGAYHHHIPPTLDQLLLRGEFYTAYTPYQPEVAQGTLQAIWEFQTLVSELFGLPLANASMYDGASAAAEAVQMARRLTKRDGVVLSECLHLDYRQTVRTYLGGDEAIHEVRVGADGCADQQLIAAALDQRVAAVVVGYPSFFGGLADLRPLAAAVHAAGALLITATTEPYALALAEAPGAFAVDIAVGEGQALACPPQFGGPGVGLFACRQNRDFLRQLPGRLCGETVDSRGERGYVLTLSTREQHIRRERATSNICTNQGLMALAFTIRLSLLGKTGFQRTAEACLAKARYLQSALLELGRYEACFTAPHYFNEFCLRVRHGSAAELCNTLEQQGIIAGFDLGRLRPEWSDRLLIATTERHTRADLDRFVAALRLS